MKIVDEYHTITNEKIQSEILNSLELVLDLVHFNHRNLDDYTRYRMVKALEKIKMYNKEIKTK